MSGILHNVVIHPPAQRQSTRKFFRTISRTDGKTAIHILQEETPILQEETPAPRRSGPKKCPLCGTSHVDKPLLFKRIGDAFECTECHTRISETGTVLTFDVEY